MFPLLIEQRSLAAAIEADAKRLGVASVILEGEAVVLDEQGAVRTSADFSNRSVGGGGKLNSGALIMFAFDLLFLKSLLKDEQDAIRLSEEIEGDGREIFAAACEHGLEGIIAKYKDSSYADSEAIRPRIPK
ncbi:hypothetical protein LPU83_pLPU83d_1608 (plasmid) [Rhizobium favelukesii]|uniref:ATP-dependent DNA ligase family profile domain-containing protein n=1 Tax=Rhizobium favelukesii TaxID=348824 RepID=W6RWK9_9HYPH|nr:hypothetical protein LPU83_pLPU83d_1608 [Rhizobium favelukesii]